MIYDRRPSSPLDRQKANEILLARALYLVRRDRYHKAYNVVGGERIGNASLEDGEKSTTGIPRVVCQRIARTFEADVFEDDRD